MSHSTELQNEMHENGKRKAEQQQDRQQPAKKKRRRRRLTFVERCKRKYIPSPMCNKRELEHLNECKECQELWPLFLFYQRSDYQLNEQQVAQKWEVIPEKDRLQELDRLRKRDRIFIKRWTKRSLMSGYQLFTSEKRKEMPVLEKLDFIDFGAMVAGLWSDKSLEEREPYLTRAKQLKAEREAAYEALPKYKKNQISRQKRIIRKSNGIKKPHNAYILFTKTFWEKVKQQDPKPTFHETIKLASEAWKKMSAEEKIPFQVEARRAKERYISTKQKLEKKRKNVKSIVESK